MVRFGVVYGPLSGTEIPLTVFEVAFAGHVHTGMVAGLLWSTVVEGDERIGAVAGGFEFALHDAVVWSQVWDALQGLSTMRVMESCAVEIVSLQIKVYVPGFA